MSRDESQRKVTPLRQQALDRLQAQRGRLADIPEAKMEQLVHELEVHQVELEVQNEELRRTELALADALARYQDLYDSAPVSYLTLDRDGKIVQANHAAAALCACERDELERTRLTELVVYEDVNPVAKLLAQVVATGVPLGSDFQIRRRTGNRRWVHAEISRLARNETSGFRVMLLDVTARVAAEQALRASEARFRLASDAGATLVYESDGSGRTPMIVHGLERVTGYDAVPRISAAWWAGLVHPEDQALYRRHLDALTAENTRHAVIYRIRRKDGAWITVEECAHVPGDPAKSGLRIIGTIVDITDRYQAEDALRAADRRKDEFLATLAHELRNPLAPIRNAVALLHATGSTAAGMRWAREVIERQTNQMSLLVDDLLDVSRITSGKIDLRREPIELRQVIGDAVEGVGSLIREKEHHISINMPRAPIVVNADAMRLTQILQNLISNAAKFTPPSGQIEISARRDGSHAVITVADNGVGIDADLLPHVFDMFAQGRRSPDHQAGGLGIGLTLVKRLVELHGGEISVHSRGITPGSEFVVRLPATDAPPAHVHHEPARGTRTAHHRILVVDDNRDSAESMAQLLRLLGNEVHTAHDGDAALVRLDEIVPDVVLLDIGLPGRNGYDVARAVRERRGENVLLIAMTGWGQDEDRRRSKEAGFNHHLTKPVDLEQLTQLLGDASAHA